MTDQNAKRPNVDPKAVSSTAKATGDKADDKMTKKTTKKTMTGAGILWECLEREGVTGRFRLSRRRHSARL